MTRAAIGRLIAKISRQDAAWTSQPPSERADRRGDAADRPDQAPIALPRSSGCERGLQDRQAARRQQRRADPLQRPRGDQARRVRARGRTRPRPAANQTTPIRKSRRGRTGRPDAPASSSRPARVSVYAETTHCKAGQAGAEVPADGRQRDADHGRVDRGHRRTQDHRRQHPASRPAGVPQPARPGRGPPPGCPMRPPRPSRPGPRGRVAYRAGGAAVPTAGPPCRRDLACPPH